MPRRFYEAIKEDGKRVKTQYSPDKIMQVSKLVSLGYPQDFIWKETGVAYDSIYYVASLDPIDD